MIYFCRLRVVVIYDESFKQFNAGSQSASETRIRSIFNHVQSFYSYLNVNGQTNAIIPELMSIHHATGRYWTADSSLRY